MLKLQLVLIINVHSHKSQCQWNKGADDNATSTAFLFIFACFIVIIYEFTYMQVKSWTLENVWNICRFSVKLCCYLTFYLFTFRLFHLQWFTHLGFVVLFRTIWWFVHICAYQCIYIYPNIIMIIPLSKMTFERGEKAIRQRANNIHNTQWQVY